MDKDLSKRVKSVSEIKNHPWLRDVNWNEVLEKNIQPPFIPSIYESNFDSNYQDLPVEYEEFMNPEKRYSTDRR